MLHPNIRTKVRSSMIELIFAWKRVQERHRSAPLLKERERYLIHLREQGFTRERLSTTANLLLQIVRVMSLTELRTVSETEIREAAMRWSVDVDGHLGGQPGPGSERVFRWCAIHWFSFHKVLLPTPQPEPPFFEFLADFIRAANERGLSPVTVQCYAERAGYFLSGTPVASKTISLRSAPLKSSTTWTRRLRQAGPRRPERQ